MWPVTILIVQIERPRDAAGEFGFPPGAPGTLPLGFFIWKKQENKEKVNGFQPRSVNMISLTRGLQWSLIYVAGLVLPNPHYRAAGGEPPNRKDPYCIHARQVKWPTVHALNLKCARNTSQSGWNLTIRLVQWARLQSWCSNSHVDRYLAVWIFDPSTNPLCEYLRGIFSGWTVLDVRAQCTRSLLSGEGENMYKVYVYVPESGAYFSLFACQLHRRGNITNAFWLIEVANCSSNRARVRKFSHGTAKRPRFRSTGRIGHSEDL